MGAVASRPYPRSAVYEAVHTTGTARRESGCTVQTACSTAVGGAECRHVLTLTILVCAYCLRASLWLWHLSPLGQRLLHSMCMALLIQFSSQSSPSLQSHTSSSLIGTWRGRCTNVSLYQLLLSFLYACCSRARSRMAGGSSKSR